MIWIRSRRCAGVVTWFCYQMIAKSGNNAGPTSWSNSHDQIWLRYPYFDSFEVCRDMAIHSALLTLCDGNRFPLQRDSNAGLWFLLLNRTSSWTNIRESPMMWDDIELTWHWCNAFWPHDKYTIRTEGQSSVILKGNTLCTATINICLMPMIHCVAKQISA